jgi:class 3 adenylate cyclase/pimeloyl-ACP methyl ester carboxylesterase
LRVVEPPQTRYVVVDGAQVAYQTFGSGPRDLVFMSGLASAIDFQWENARWQHLYERLGSFSRLIVFDRRGTGSSDALKVEQLGSWEQWTDDLTAVLDAAGSRKAVLVAAIDSGPWALLFAATRPDRTSAVVLWNTFAKSVATDDYPEGLPPETEEAAITVLESLWATEDFSRLVEPAATVDPAELAFHVRWQRLACTPASAAAQARLVGQTDARGVLPLIHAPTLVLHNDNESLPSSLGRYMADHIPGAQFIAVPGTSMGLWFSEVLDSVLDHIEEFVTGVKPVTPGDRVLAAVLFTDIVGSTARAAAIGDRAWRDVLETHDSISRTIVQQHAGRLIKYTGDGVLSTFDGPGRAIQCARALREALQSVGVDIRAGVHTGEIELRREDIGGIAVHVAARVVEHADPGEVLVSSAVPLLVAGSNIQFAPRGEHELKGLPGEWALFAVV